MNTIKITDLTKQLGISSRSLRYYEQIGLIESVRHVFEKYRSYDEENVEKLRQIMVLRKMQIPIKDIINIYRSRDTSVVVETFVKRIRAIDEEVAALSELKRVVNDFLEAMLESGITKISALPLLYEKMEKQLETLESRKVITRTNLSFLSEKLVKVVEPSIICLPSMRVVSSLLKENPGVSDPEAFWRWIQERGIAPGEPGQHEQFEFENDSGDVIILRVPETFSNDGKFSDYVFEGGLFAAINVYLDEDLGGQFRSLVAGFDDNKFYEIDYALDGDLRHNAMLENLVSSDDKRELVMLYVPVKKRLANPALFYKADEINDISVAEIETQNPVLWEVNVPLDKLTPINGPHYRVTEQGEVEYTGWISTRVLSTNVEVKLPFRIDIEFRVDEAEALFGYGSDEGSIRLYHGEDLNHLFAINMGNRADKQFAEEALCFHQPVFGDYFKFPHQGKIKQGEYNCLTWIAGEKHFAVIINGELRYCGVNFPYMAMDLKRQKARPIVVGSDGQGKKYFRSIRVSQLAYTPKLKIKEGELKMNVKRSNNVIPNIHRLITSEFGENYWFNGCAKYVMESLGEPDYTYEFFAGLTGDVFAQIFSFNSFRGDGVTDYRLSCSKDGAFIKEVFKTCGYASSFVSEDELRSNPEMYARTLTAYIDKGVPVITNNRFGWAVFVGYEEYGRQLLYLTGDKTEPEHISLEEVLRSDHPDSSEMNRGWYKGWIFVGDKKEKPELAKIYRDTIQNLPQLLGIKTDDFCFGAGAFRAWADKIENGGFDQIKPEEFDGWAMYVNYVCNLATNGSCCYAFLDKAMELNPDFSFLKEVRSQYEQMGRMWNNDGGKDLEALGGGFNITLEALQDKAKRSKIAAKIREFAGCVDEVIRILQTNCG